MADVVSVQAVNFEEVRRALAEAPDLAFKFVGSDLKRSGNRFRKRFIAARMSGAPGIAWDQGKLKVGRNVRAFVRGERLQNLGLEVRISRFLRIHEEGATISAKNGGWLYLSRKTGVKGEGEIVAKAKSITVPARLGFLAFWEEQVPDMLQRAQNALSRSVQVAFERRMKTVVGLIGRATNG